MDLRRTWKIRRLFVVHLLLLLEMCGGRSGKLAVMARRHRNKGNQWWNLAHTRQMMSADPLSTETNLFLTPPVHPLTRRQLKLVSKNPGTTMAVASGARTAVEECQYQFRHRRWNCSVMSEYSHGGSIFGKILKKGCRETAFIYAITSAALTHSISRACSSGTVYTCSCGQRTDLPRSQRRQRAGRRRRRQRPPSAAPPSTPGQAGATDWQWGGCSDNGAFGYRFSRDFIDVNERGRDLRCAMNLHNNEAGRTHVLNQMRQECKCHGMSGSCAIKTCWMKLPSFRQVGVILNNRFRRASKVDPGNDWQDRGRLSLVPVDSSQRQPSRGDLVFYENSPAFCDADLSLGHHGVTGRRCNATSSGEDGCHRMCCGRGYTSTTRPGRERCNCVFHWCCRVTCDTCLVQHIEHTCN